MSGGHKLNEYQEFLESILLPQLDQAKRSKGQTLQEKQEYEDLLEKLGNLTAKEPTVTTMEVDLGHGKVFCQARPDFVDKTEEEPMVFVHVGMGFHVEFTVSEAGRFVGQRLAHLDQLLQRKSAKVKQVEEHVMSAKVILDGLAQELHRNH